MGGVFLSFKVQAVMSDEMVAKMDQAAKELNISRSAYVCVAVSEKLRNDLMSSHLSDMVEFMKAYRTSGEINASPSLLAAMDEFSELMNINKK